MIRLLFVTILTLVFLCSGVCASSESLILYLPFDEGSGAVAGDSSDNGNDGELSGNVEWAEGRINGCVQLASGSYVELPEIPVYDVTDAVSLMAWIKIASVTTWARVIDKSQWQDNGFDLAISQATHAPLFEFFVNGTTTQALATTTVDDDQWHFIAGTFGNKKARIYVNGVMEQEVASTGDVDIKPNDLPIRLGVEANPSKGQPYMGLIDEAAIFNSELSADEIMDIYENGVPTTSPVDSKNSLAATWGALKK